MQSSQNYVPGPLHQLPQAPDLVGRDDELRDLEKLLTTSAAGATISGKHAGLQGMGGVGKTALALALAWRLKDRYPDAQLFVTLHGTRQPLTPAAAMQAVIRCFLPDARLPEEIEQLQPIYNSVLQEGGRRCLLLLDDAAGAEQVTPLLPPPGCLLLVTSRHQFTLPGLTARNLDCLKPDKSVELLLKLAPRMGGDAAAAAELCGHLPLALDVFAAMVNEKTLFQVSELLQRLRDKRATLEKVDAAFAVSCDLLDEPLRRRWYRLGVFSASFDLDAAEEVWGEAPQAVEVPAPARANEHGQPDTPKGELQPEAREAMQALVNASLVEWNERNGRFRLHDLARDYAARQLTPEEELAARMNHARHFTAVGERADELYLAGGGKILDGLALFDRERRHIEAAFEFLHSCSRRREEAESEPSGGIRLLTSAATKEAACRQLVALVHAVAYTGDLRFHPRQQRIPWLEAQLAAACEIGDRCGEGAALGNLGVAYKNLGDARKAIEYHEQRLVIAREIGDRCGEGAALGNLGVAYMNLGDARKAIEYHEQRLVIAREIGNRRGEGNALGSLGNAYADLGDARKAIEFYEQRLVIAREIGDRRGEGNALGNLGSAYGTLGDARKAIEFYEQALVIDREIGDVRGEAIDLYNYALASDKLGQRDEAIRRAEAALTIFEQIEAPHAAKVRARLAEWKGAEGS
ncbi:MAG: tetratricopeptide repeat protein [Verrucomicrobia bacterium]|nr:tetratricopeptide repeat protein [Verrucomicrobiota bacterium]